MPLIRFLKREGRIQKLFLFLKFTESGIALCALTRKICARKLTSGVRAQTRTIFFRQITTVSSIWQIKVPHKSKANDSNCIPETRRVFVKTCPRLTFFEGVCARRKSIYAPEMELRRSFPAKWDRSDITDVMSTPQMKANTSTNWKKKKIVCNSSFKEHGFWK